jgi:hypothetical protein
VPKILIRFAAGIRVYRWRENLRTGDVRKMRNQEETVGKDIFLLLFVGVALWLLLFQSNLFN